MKNKKVKNNEVLMKMVKKRPCTVHARSFLKADLSKLIKIFHR